MKNNQKVNQNPNQLDFATPIVEVLQFVVTSILKLGFELLKFSYNRLVNKNPEVLKIERKALHVKKQTCHEEAIGVDTKSKREILLKDINFKRHSFIVGGSGYGKTNLMSILQENSLKQGKPIYFLIPREIYWH